MRDKIICILMLFISFNIFAYERVDLVSENSVDKIYVDKIIQNYFWDDYDSTRLIKTYSEIEGNFIKEYLSCQHAKRETNIDNSSIAKSARKVKNKAGGYIWRYKEDIDFDENNIPILILKRG